MKETQDTPHFNRVHLAPVEDRLLGGTVGEGEDLLTPRSIQQGMSTQDVIEAREGQEIDGHFSWLGLPQMRYLSERGRTVVLTLAEVDPESGKLIPHWKAEVKKKDTGEREPFPQSFVFHDLEVTNGQDKMVVHFETGSTDMNSGV